MRVQVKDAGGDFLRSPTKTIPSDAVLAKNTALIANRVLLGFPVSAAEAMAQSGCTMNPP